MVGTFNNCNVFTENTVQQKHGLVAQEGKIARVILSPKEDQWRMVTYRDGAHTIAGTEGVFQFTTEDNFPVRFGIGTFENNELVPVIYAKRDADNELYWLCNINGETKRGKLISFKDLKGKINTLLMGYKQRIHYFSINNIMHFSIPITVLFPNKTPVFFIEFDTTLKAIYMGGLHKPIDKLRNLVTEKPNFFIKDYNA